MDRLFRPESVVVVGVSDRPTNMGRAIVHNMIAHGYGGEIYLKGRRPGNVFGHRVRTSWEEVPDGVDLAAILVPAAQVPETLERLADRGIERAVISTSGFQELGPDRVDLQRQVHEVAQRRGIRFIGPNCFGVADFGHGLCTAFVSMSTDVRPGDVHVLAQSGGVGVEYLNRLAAASIGIGVFATIGNKLDMDECDLLDYLETRDPRFVCLYLEDVRDGRRLFETLKDYPSPVILQKSNRTEAGARAAASHTASMAGDDRVMDAALRQAGAHRVHDTTRLLIQARGFSLPPMKGKRLFIVSRSGGHAVIASDLVDRYGFELPPLDEQTAERLQAHTRAGVIRANNPLDLGDVFDFRAYARLLEDVLRSDEVDGVLFVHVWGPGPEQKASRGVFHAVGELMRRHGKPIYACALTTPTELLELRREVDFPIFEEPGDAMRAAAAARDERARRARPASPLARTDGFPAPDAIRAVIDDARRRGQRVLGAEAIAIAEHAGFPVAPHAIARTRDEVADLARQVGFPIALKVLSEDVSHKSDSGGVVLSIPDEQRAVEAWDDVMRSVLSVVPDARIEGVILQRMERGFREILIGAKQDPSFGPVVMVGLGGVAVELFRDVSLRLAPLTDRDIEEMLSEVVSFRALWGVRSLPAADVPFLIDSIARMSELIVAYPEIQEIELNPLKLHRAGHGGRVVDARALLAD